MRDEDVTDSFTTKGSSEDMPWRKTRIKLQIYLTKAIMCNQVSVDSVITYSSNY